MCHHFMTPCAHNGNLHLMASGVFSSLAIHTLVDTLWRSRTNVLAAVDSRGCVGVHV